MFASNITPFKHGRMDAIALSLSLTDTHIGNIEKANNLVMKYATVNAKINRLTKELHPQPSCY